MTTPELLVEKMVDSCLHQPNFISEIPRYKKQKEELEPIATEMLRIVLQAIQSGEVVEIEETHVKYTDDYEHRIVLTQPFSDFMKGK